MYRIALYQTTGTSQTQTVLFAPGDCAIEAWSKRINAPGKLIFTMHKFHAKATAQNLRPYRRARLYRKDETGTYVPVWFGYIEATKEQGAQVEVVCVGMLQLFKKRYTATDEQFNGQGSTEAFDLLDAVNAAGATGIVTGTGGVTTTRDLTLGEREVLRAWEELARAHGAEFEIDDDGQFNFVSSLGQDQSSAVELIFRRDGQPGTNVDDYDTGDDGAPMANRVIGTNATLTSTKNDATSQAAYGLLIERKRFEHANDQATLDALTQAYVDQRANPITDVRIQPTLATKKFNPTTGQRVVTGLRYGDVAVGDLVTVTIRTENASTSTAKRIAEIVVSVDATLRERLSFTLSEAGVFVTATLLGGTEFENVRQRLAEIEREL